MSGWWNHWRRKRHITKNRVERYLSVDSSEIYDNRLSPFEEGEESFIYGYKIKCYSSYALFSFYSESDCSYRIPIETTSCNYGGTRHWFLCPIPNCNRRSKKLYLHPKGIFICRKCLNLAYSSQNKSAINRIIDKKWDLVQKLGADSDILIYKPKRMHQKTFDRMQEEISRLNVLAVQRISQMCGKFSIM